jgi:putative ABC transport system permease protein
MFALLYDLRFSFRMIGRNPAFSIVGIVTLAVGIGAGTTVFSWLDSVPL